MVTHLTDATDRRRVHVLFIIRCDLYAFARQFMHECMPTLRFWGGKFAKVVHVNRSLKADAIFPIIENSLCM